MVQAAAVVTESPFLRDSQNHGDITNHAQSNPRYDLDLNVDPNFKLPMPEVVASDLVWYSAPKSPANHNGVSEKSTFTDSLVAPCTEDPRRESAKRSQRAAPSATEDDVDVKYLRYLLRRRHKTMLCKVEFIVHILLTVNIMFFSAAAGYGEVGMLQHDCMIFVFKEAPLSL